MSSPATSARTPSALQRLDRLADAADAARGPVAVVGRPHHRDRQGGVGLDRLGEVAGRGAPGARRGRAAGAAPRRAREAARPRRRRRRGGGRRAALGAQPVVRVLPWLIVFAHRRPGPRPCAAPPHRSAAERASSLALNACSGGRLGAQALRAPAPTRATASSRPSAASESKIPGETVVPVIATRSGW